MRIKRFNSFEVNEEISFNFFKNVQKKIEDYVDFLFISSRDKDSKTRNNLRTDIDKYIKSVRYDVSISAYKTSIQNVKDMLNQYGYRDAARKDGALLTDSKGNKRPAVEVIEEEIARIVLKSLNVRNKNGKWVSFK